MEHIPIAKTGAYVVLADRYCGDARTSLDWIFLQQQHSGDVVVIGDGARDRNLVLNSAPNDYFPSSLALGDAIVTKRIDATIGALGADCGLVGLASNEDVAAVIHVGWRGLLADIIKNTIAAMHMMDATRIWSVIGPCIHSECYEFDYNLAKEISLHINYNVVGETSLGKPSLDLPLAINKLLERENVDVLDTVASCTACDERWFSHRARRDSMRHGLGVLWR